MNGVNTQPTGIRETVEMFHDHSDMGTIAKRARRNAAIIIANWLTDPTPLTVEQLVESVVRAGGKCSGDDAMRIGRLTFALCEIEVIVGVSIDGKHVPPELWPRTLGELAHLLTMMEGR